MKKHLNALPTFHLVDEPWSLAGPMAQNFLSQGLTPDESIRHVEAPRTGQVARGDTVYLLQQEAGQYPSFAVEIGETRIPGGATDITVHHLQLVARDGTFLEKFAESGFLNANAVVDGQQFFEET